MTATPAADTVHRLGSAVRDVRKRQSLTQAELAHRAHVSRMFVIDLEAGHPAPGLGKALAVLEALGIPSIIDDRSDDMTATASRRPAPTRAEDRLAFSDAALALAGHEVSDPALRTITERAARGDLTADEAIAAARRRVQGVMALARRRSAFRDWDDYYIPGTTVLRNKFTGPGRPHGEPDPDKLKQLEEVATAVRLQELFDDPIQGRFDYDHMKAIHRHVFQDVYDWAGEERVGPPGFMSKDGHSYYPAGPSLTEAAEAEYRKLAAKDHLRGLGQDEFVHELAESWGELNVVHSFREGNTRTQFAFFHQLAEQAGYRIDTRKFASGAPLRDDFVAARFHSQDTGSNQRLAEVLGQAVSPIPEPEPDLEAGPARAAEMQRLEDDIRSRVESLHQGDDPDKYEHG